MTQAAPTTTETEHQVLVRAGACNDTKTMPGHGGTEATRARAEVRGVKEHGGSR